jgi:SPOR domain
LADNTFHPLRSRQTPAPERASAGASDANDPLAELARLIGQSDPYAERQADARDRAASAERDAPPAHEWADQEEVEQAYAAEDRYAPPPAMPRASPLRDYAARGDEGEYEHEPHADDQYYSGASDYEDERENPRQQRSAPSARPVPAFLTSGPSDENAEFAEPEHDAADAYAPEEYYQPSQRRRGGLVLVMAVLGLAIVGTAGAFAYRTMFGGSLLPALPPIIKANTSPNKLMPNSADTQAANSSQGGMASASAGENVVSREEQPINIDPPKPAPRIISTIPVNSNNQSAALPPSVVASVAPIPGPAAQATAPGSAPPTNPDWASSPATAAPVATAPAQPSPAVSATAAPAAPPSEPKKIHTVAIRPDQAGAVASRGAAARAAAPADGNAPLALVPGGGDAATATQPRSRRSPSTTAVASTTTASTGASEAAPSVGYAVQVSSQHSETEAQSSFQALRAKYPELLGKREPIIRRADLGAKGIYYRALVGPFASAEEAASMCSSLKAAGGNCIVQKN